MVDILREKRDSNKIIDDIMMDASRLSSEAFARQFPTRGFISN
jgi:hypothetical protein